MNRFNFFGIGIEAGQKYSGLAHSHHVFRNYFSILEQIGFSISDFGFVTDPHNKYVKINSYAQENSINWLPYIEAYQRIGRILQLPGTLVNWGGDHSVGISTVGAYCSTYDDGYVLWIDAHADLNIPGDSPTGSFHGMPLSVLLNLQNLGKRTFPWIDTFLRPERLIYLGIRDVDPFERSVIEDYGIQYFTAAEVSYRGINSIAAEILEKIKGFPLHISFDIDSVSPEFAPSTGVPSINGLKINDLYSLGTALSHHENICSLDFVEINPNIGTQEQVYQTYMVALSFLKTMLWLGGKNDDVRRTNKKFFATQMESRS